MTSQQPLLPLMLSPHLSLAEFEASDAAKRHGIPNKVPDYLLPSAFLLATEVFEPIRELLGDRPIKISSGYRCSALNRQVGGVSSSQHVKAEALDFLPSAMSVKVAYNMIKDSTIPYDQLILEQSDKVIWIHVSYDASKPRDKQRRSALHITL